MFRTLYSKVVLTSFPSTRIYPPFTVEATFQILLFPSIWPLLLLFFVFGETRAKSGNRFVGREEMGKKCPGE